MHYKTEKNWKKNRKLKIDFFSDFFFQNYKKKVFSPFFSFFLFQIHPIIYNFFFPFPVFLLFNFSRNAPNPSSPPSTRTVSAPELILSLLVISASLPRMPIFQSRLVYKKNQKKWILKKFQKKKKKPFQKIFIIFSLVFQN